MQKAWTQHLRPTCPGKEARLGGALGGRDGSGCQPNKAQAKRACSGDTIKLSCCSQQAIVWIVSETFQFTPGQLRSVASIAPETYRHWRKALAPLRRDRGHSPCFTSGDLVAVAVVRILCADLGIRVGTLGGIADMLFDLCNESPWPMLQRGKLVLDISNGEVHFQPELANAMGEGTVVIVPLRPIVEGLSDQLLAVREPEEQQVLRFPPTALPSVPPPATMRGRP